MSNHHSDLFIKIHSVYDYAAGAYAVAQPDSDIAYKNIMNKLGIILEQLNIEKCTCDNEDEEVKKDVE